MNYIIGIMLIFIVVILVGLFYRKKIYREVDRLEAWKIDIMNRPITDELGKVKDLNMTGQTEKLFERWRSEWDELVTVDLPNIEELLLDTEEYADKYRFNKAKSVMKKIESILKGTEDKIQIILKELQELIGSEEKNRLEIEKQKLLLRELKKSLLAHIHSFGKAESALEQQLSHIEEKFQEFDFITNEGNYLQAREIVLYIQGHLSVIQDKMDKIPPLLVECESAIPAQLDEIMQGYNELINQNYSLDHIPINKEVEQIQSDLVELVRLLEMTEVDEVFVKLSEIKEKIETLYDLLEKEVLAHHFVKNEAEKIDEALQSLNKEAKQTKDDTQFVSKSYHLSDFHLEKYRQIEKQIQHLLNRYSKINTKIKEETIAYSVVREELEGILNQIQLVKNHHDEFQSFLQALRKDELQAREEINHLRKLLLNSKRLIEKSNIPGVPNAYILIMQEAKEKLELLKMQLEEKPLDMDAINSTLKSAVEIVTKTDKYTIEMIEQATLVERVIQYGNRYRSQNWQLAVKLIEAESLFRNFEYDLALEQAATAIEEVDPNALKHIEELLKENNL